MKNPIKDIGLSLSTIGMHYILITTLKVIKLEDPSRKHITIKDIERVMGLKLGLDREHDKELKKLARTGYIIMEQIEPGHINITLI